MVNRILSLFARQPAGGGAKPAAHSPEEKHIAAVALLVEAASLDGDFGAPELAAIEAIAASRFALNKEEVASLVTLARDRQGSSNQIFGFTHQINQSFPPEERIEVVEMLWEVVYADGVLHDYEANLMRRIGGLIYVSDTDRGNARKRVMARLGIE
ncbi:MAG TPA: TerB family tellurite resistance protein [Alphaproteobacteria bacterium]|nr:TerB family tellurite resistance protein [Alphaproteobacteria bacterium]